MVTDIIGTGKVSPWRNRGLLNIVREINKVLFGTLDENNADYYEGQIRNFEQNTEDTTELLKQQVYVARSTLGALNSTLAGMEYNSEIARMKAALSDLEERCRTLERAEKGNHNIYGGRGCAKSTKAPIPDRAVDVCPTYEHDRENII